MLWTPSRTPGSGSRGCTSLRTERRVRCLVACTNSAMAGKLLATASCCTAKQRNLLNHHPLSSSSLPWTNPMQQAGQSFFLLLLFILPLFFSF